MTKTKPKKQIVEYLNSEKPSKDLRLADYNQDERFKMLESYLFDIKVTYNKTGKKIYTKYYPGLYMEDNKPDLEQILIPETDEMWITINNTLPVDPDLYKTSIKFGKTKYVSISPSTFMNPDFVNRINHKNLSGNLYDKLILKREDIMDCLNKLIAIHRGILTSMLSPDTELETCGIDKQTCKRIESFTDTHKRTRLKQAILALCKGIVSYQEKLI